MARSTTLPPSQLQLEEEEGQEPAKTNSSFDEEDDEDMAPQPDDDLFIEPAGDYDVIYGDSNSTMASTSGTRPYLRLNSYLRNATKEEGEQARFKCEAAGSPLPLTFSWLKNHAPLDKNGKRVRIRNRDYWSRLVITDLDVLDSGHYQCIVTNPVGSVNTTGVLRVQKPKDFASRRRPQQRPLDYDDLSVSTVDHDQIPGRLPADWVPGPNFVPNGDQSTSESHVWLDGVKLNKGDCILYQGEACKHLLAGRYVMVTTTNREEMLDIDRNLRAAMMFINTSPKISDECKQHSHVVACYHKYKLCDGPNSVGNFLSKAVNFWTDLPNHYQYASFGGAGLIALLILLAICLCCCRRKRKLKKRRHGKQNGHGQTSLNGSLLLNSSANGGVATNPYYHKLNGGSAALMSAGQQSNAAFELSSLLPQQYNQQPPSRSPPGLSNSTALVDNCSEPLPEVPFDRLEYGDPMGEGQFGTVYRGTMRGYGAGDEATLEVAIKTLKDDLLPRQRSDFVKEIRYMCRLRHQNVVELIGVCNGPDGEPNLAVFEYMIHGDLHDFLMLRAPSPVERYVNSADVANGGMDMERVSKDHADFLNIAVQVACGMEYLASMCYVHRDLAARNCLVSDHMVIKIADFGLMRPSYEKDYYQMQHRTMMPVRWMPPEALIYGQFSEASDVWAFGVTLWEIYSYGRQPHEGYTNGEVIDLVRSRNLLEAPRNAPTRMYSLMVECWHENPSRRPRFAELHGRLQTWAVMGSPAQSSAMSAPYHHQQQRHHQPGSTHSGGSSTAQQGRTSRQSSVPSSSVLLNHNNHNQRSVVNGTSTVPITTNGGYVPPPAPMPIQTMLTLNGVHPYHNGANGRTAGKSAVDTSSSPMMRDNCSPMTRKQQQQQQAYHYSEDGEDDSSD